MLQAVVLSALIATTSLEPFLERMQNVVLLAGSFQQTDYWALTLEEEISSGTMYIAHPDLFLLEYSDPQGAAAGYDGTCLFTIEPDLQQVIVYPERSPGSFLHMIQRCADSSITETVELEGDSIVVFLEGDFGQGIYSMRVGFTPSDSLPYLFCTTDVNGNSTSYSMWDVQALDSYPENRFALSIPDGYELLDPGEMQSCPQPF